LTLSGAWGTSPPFFPSSRRVGLFSPILHTTCSNSFYCQRWRGPFPLPLLPLFDIQSGRTSSFFVPACGLNVGPFRCRFFFFPVSGDVLTLPSVFLFFLLSDGRGSPFFFSPFPFPPPPEAWFPQSSFPSFPACPFLYSPSSALRYRGFPSFFLFPNYGGSAHSGWRFRVRPSFFPSYYDSGSFFPFFFFPFLSLFFQKARVRRSPISLQVLTFFLAGILLPPPLLWSHFVFFVRCLECRSPFFPPEGGNAFFFSLSPLSNLTLTPAAGNG